MKKMLMMINDDDGESNKASFLGVGCFPIFPKPRHWPDSQQVHGGGRKRLELSWTREKKPSKILNNLPTYPERGEVRSATNSGCFSTIQQIPLI